jgi:excisionase family DNA binding protein
MTNTSVSQVAPQGLLSYHTLSRLFGVPVGTLYSWVSKRQIPHIRFGRRYVRFDIAEIQRWISERRVPQTDCSRPPATTKGLH